MNIKTVEFEVNGRTYWLAVKGKSIVFSNDLEVIGRFDRKLLSLDEGIRDQMAEQIFIVCNEITPDHGDLVEYSSLLKSML